MHDYELVPRTARNADAGTPVTDEGLTIGRVAGCDIVLSDPLASRVHARIWIEDDRVCLEDMGSRNGVSVNGRRIWRGCLLPDDEVAIGSHSFRLRATRAREPESTHGSTIRFHEAETIVEDMVRSGRPEGLRILYNAARLLGTVFDLNELLERILALVFDALPARRGFILAGSVGETEPEVRATRCSDETDGAIPLCGAIIGHVFEQRGAVLTFDALRDPRFSDSDSAREHGIQAAMCVPLFGRESLIGAIYVDSGPHPGTFVTEDLELLTSVGRVVGVAVENAQLHREKVSTERMAAIGQATAGIGHCVKNALVGVKGGCEFVGMGIERGDWAFTRKGWDLVRRSSERVESLVRNIMTFSRDHTPEFRPTDVNYLVEEAIETVRPRAEKIQVEVAFEKGKVELIQADGQEIFRVILNLVTNALDACEEKTNVEGNCHPGVRIRTERRGNVCLISVSDTGPGISEEVRGRLFQAFASTKGSRGTGLGLACSQKIVRAHDGCISVDSAPGKGATFTVSIPAGSG